MTCWEVFDTPSYHLTCPTSFGWSLDTSPCQVSEILQNSEVYRATTKFHSPHNHPEIFWIRTFCIFMANTMILNIKITWVKRQFHHPNSFIILKISRMFNFTETADHFLRPGDGLPSSLADGVSPSLTRAVWGPWVGTGKLGVEKLENPKTGANQSVWGDNGGYSHRVSMILYSIFNICLLQIVDSCRL